MSARTTTAALCALLALALAAAPAGSGAAAGKISPDCAKQLRRALRARSRLPACALSGRGGGPFGDWGRLRGDVFEFDGVQISGTMTAYEPRDRDGDWSFRASTRTTIRPLVRTEGEILRRELTEVGGRFTLARPIVVAAIEHVGYSIRGSATYTRSDGRQFDCTYDPPTGIDRLGMTLWSQRDRVAVRFNAYNGGWACGREVVFAPSCHGDPGQADIMFYKPIEFTRRWIKLPIDLQFRTGTGLICEHRFNGFVRLKKLRDGR